jgi:hypothetical protein
MAKITPKTTIHTALITAFTLTAALLWRDTIVAVIEYLVPPKEKVIYEFLVAIIATMILILAIYIIFKTESEARHLSKLIQKRKKLKKKRK